MASFLFIALVLNTGAMILVDDLRPGIRDPEYGRRVRHYQERAAENPGRSMVMVVGSSRAAMGVRPGAWEEVRGQSQPLLFNMSLLGGGPIMELMVARRASADGLRPSVVLFEYWPPYLYSEENWTESKRIVIDRLSPVDRPIVREFFPNHAAVEARIAAQHWNPIWHARAAAHSGLAQVGAE